MSSTYHTKDTPEAAFLWSLDGTELVQLVPAQRAHSNSIEVTFELTFDMSEEELQALLLKYRNRKCKVEPNHFMSVLNNLRGLLRDCIKKANVKGA